MDCKLSTFSILSYNCKSIKRSKQCVRELTKNNDIVLLQETWLLPHDLNFVNEINEDFGCVAKSSVDTSAGILRGRPYGGLAIMWNKTKFPYVSPISCNSDRLAAVRISTGKGCVIVINVYMPVDNADNLTEFIDCLGAINAIIEEGDTQCVYVLGDFNAHPSAKFGLELIKFCTDMQWECVDFNLLGVNSETFTFMSESHGCQRWLDHCISTKAAWDTVIAADVIYDVVWSDHYPLRIVCDITCMNVGIASVVPSDHHQNRIKWGTRTKEQINVYQKHCCDKLSEDFNIFKCDCENNINCEHFDKYCESMDWYYTYIVDTLQPAAVLSSRLGEQKRCKKVIGWNYHVRDCHQTARYHFKVWVEAGRPLQGLIFENMRSSRSVFKNKIKWCQKNEDCIKMNILALHRKENNFVKFWNATKKFNCKQSLPVSVDGLQDTCKIADLFASKFKIDPLPADCELSSDTVVTESLPPFTPEDVISSVKNMKRGKSPGHDGLSVEHLVWGSANLFPHLSEFFNLCVKHAYLPKPLMRTVVVPVVKNRTGDLSASGNYRPISLGTIIGKVLERLIQPELQKKLKIDDAQFGFRPGLSTDSAIISLKSTIAYYTHQRTSVYACFLDLSKAFDLVNYEILWDKLKTSQVPHQIVDLLRFWYGGQTNQVKWGDTLSNSYRLDCGVRQGGLTSPDLFNLYINDLIGELKRTKVGCHLGNVCVNSLSYADDMVLLSPSIKSLRKLLSVCEHYADAHGLKYNVLKTEAMVFRSGAGPGNIPSLYLNGATIKVVKQFKYLGHILTDRLQDDCDIERERRALSVRSNMLARTFVKCTRDVKNTLFRAYCLPMYTCQLWCNFTKKMYNSLRVQYNDAYRTLMRMPRYCSASSMFAEARVPDFYAIMRSRVASFWQSLRRSSNSILKVVSCNLASPMFAHWISVHLSENKK